MDRHLSQIPAESSEPDIVSLFDPTEPLQKAVDKTQIESKIAEEKTILTRLNLTSILISHNRKVAIINNRIVREGERVNGIKIIAITPKAVRLKGDGKEYQVKLRQKGSWLREKTMIEKYND